MCVCMCVCVCVCACVYVRVCTCINCVYDDQYVPASAAGLNVCNLLGECASKRVYAMVWYQWSMVGCMIYIMMQTVGNFASTVDRC